MKLPEFLEELRNLVAKMALAGTVPPTLLALKPSGRLKILVMPDLHGPHGPTIIMSAARVTPIGSLCGLALESWQLARPTENPPKDAEIRAMSPEARALAGIENGFIARTWTHPANRRPDPHHLRHWSASLDEARAVGQWFETDGQGYEIPAAARQ